MVRIHDGGSEYEKMRVYLNGWIKKDGRMRAPGHRYAKGFS
jgi:hypothetical protein